MKTHIIEDKVGIKYTVLIGRNAKENTLLVKNSDPWDIWFHLDDISSPHIVLKTDRDNDEVSKDVLIQVGRLFEYYKKALPRRYRVIYTQVRNVTPTRVLGEVKTKCTNSFLLTKITSYVE